MSTFSVKLTQPPNPSVGLSHFIIALSFGPHHVGYVSTPFSSGMANSKAAHWAAKDSGLLVASCVEKEILDQLNAVNPAGNVPPWGAMVPSGQMAKYVATDAAKAPDSLNAFKAAPPPPPSFGGMEHVLGTLEEVFPGLRGAPFVLPPCTGLPKESEFFGQVCTVKVACSIPSLIMHLNDEHRWTREQIADWLDTLDIDLSAKPNTEKESAA